MNCDRCADTGKAPRPATADHLLTDTEPWEYCPCESGRALRDGKPLPHPRPSHFSTVYRLPGDHFWVR